IHQTTPSRESYADGRKGFRFPASRAGPDPTARPRPPLAEPRATRYAARSLEAGRLPRPHRRGPLEAAASRRTWPTGCNVFRGLIAAAPLKPLTPRWNRRLHRGLPRPHRRGPIEAKTSLPLTSDNSRLPRPHRRGPIEAWIWKMYFVD